MPCNHMDDEVHCRAEKETRDIKRRQRVTETERERERQREGERERV